jgi:hypothetical protein
VTEPTPTTASARRAALVRFHLGDPDGARSRALPRAAVPEALAAAAAAGGDWPLAVDLDDPSDGFVAPLGGRDRAARAPGAELVELDPSAVVRLADLCARRRLRAARARFAPAARRLAELAAALLDADRERRADADPSAARAPALGPLGARLVDPARFAELAARRAAGAPLAPERRLRLEAARDALATFAPAAAEPVWVVADDQRLAAGAVRAVRADDPCAEAAARFDEVAREAVALLAAARLVRLEAEGAYDPERHGPALDRLDWRALAPGELALLAPVSALVDPVDLVARGLASLSRLLLSGRPVAVLVPLDCAAADLDPAAPHFEPAMLGLGHRETFVHQGSVGEPLLLARAFARALAGSRPSLHVVDRPWFEVDGYEAAAIARARIAARAAPLLRHEPEAGASWSRRLALEGNPEPAADWGRLAGGAPLTFADAALLDPSWRAQFALAEGDGEEPVPDLEPLAAWLAAEPERRARTLPFVAAVDGEGRRARLVVTLALARAAADRLAFWRSLQELSGTRSEAVERAVADALAGAAARATRERDERERHHADALARARAESAAEAVRRIAATLLAPAGGGAA